MTHSTTTHNLSPFASVFSPSAQVKTKPFDIDYALSLTSDFLSPFEFILLSDVVMEWRASPTLSSCFSRWKSRDNHSKIPPTKQLQVLLFNVRGLGERWEEVLLIAEKYKADCLVLVEIGAIEPMLVKEVFVNYKCFSQPGENPWGGVLMLFKPSLTVVRVECDIPNVCIVDVKLERPVRIVGIYSPKSKTWQWNSLSQFIKDDCVLFGDFNVDLDCKKDEKIAKDLTDWAESLALTPSVPDTPTSLRSNRTIDYALARGIPIGIQTLTDNTTSDHRPILSVLSHECKENAIGSNTHWRVFNFFLALTSEFWEYESHVASIESYYTNFISLLDSLRARCTTQYPLRKHRTAIPVELRQKLSYVRALSFQHKRTGDVALHTKIKELRRQNRVELSTIRARRLTSAIKDRLGSAPAANHFWSNLKKSFKSTNSLDAFIDSNDTVVKDTNSMLELAAGHYEQLFSESIVYRPHPYVDSPGITWENHDEPIPLITAAEVRKTIAKMKKKHSSDAHGISSYMLTHIPNSYIAPLVRMFNETLIGYSGPSYWKHVKMKLLAKKDSICSVKDTRPISLLDIFLKLLEKLFLRRFQSVLDRRGILHESQSGFRSNFRLQSRVLNLIDQISSLLSSSIPVATVFVDFRQAFDQLWWEGCLGKLTRLGVPMAYTKWIERWLHDRVAFIEMNGVRSRHFPIRRGGPQGSCLTPAIFITYHSDMWTFLQNALPNYFADDLACVIGGRIGVKYTLQCLDVERKLKTLFDQLEFYAVLSLQPINYEKTVVLWSSRAVGKPNFEVAMGERKVNWVSSFRYLGYNLTSKLGWGVMIDEYRKKIRKRVAIANACTLNGTSSRVFRRIIFNSYVMPLFTWLFCIFPLFTNCQRDELAHFFYTCLKRTIRVRYWNDVLFSSLHDEKSLEHRCGTYWMKFKYHLGKSCDGSFLMENAGANAFRTQWLNKEITVANVYRSKRQTPFVPAVGKCLAWLENNASDSIPYISEEDLEMLTLFPQSFM